MAWVNPQFWMEFADAKLEAESAIDNLKKEIEANAPNGEDRKRALTFLRVEQWDYEDYEKRFYRLQKEVNSCSSNDRSWDDFTFVF